MKHKGYLLATAGSVTAAAAAVATGSAQAAPPLPNPSPWAGWYAGLNVGAVWQSGTNTSTYGSTLSVTNTSTDFIGGGQLGYNWQEGNFVYGFEADISGLTGGANFRSHYGKNFANKIQWLSTVRGRAGLALGNTLAYMTGGVAVGGVKNSFTTGFGGSKSENRTQVGWAIGGGIEHVLMNTNWTVGLEALFVDLGQSTVTTATGKTSKFSNQAVIGRIKLNYKF